MSDTDSRRIPRLLNFTYLSLVACWMLGYITLVVRLFLAQQLLAWTDGQKSYISDFYQWYSGGYLARSADRFSVYDPDVQIKTMAQLVPLHFDKLFYNQEPPHVFAFCVPLSYLDMGTAFWIFIIFTTAAGLFAVAKLSKDLDILPKPQQKFLLLGALGSVPSYTCIHGGQISWLFVAALAGIYYFAWKRRNDFLCGFMLALTSIKPQYPLMMVVPFLVAKRWKTLAASFVSGMLMLAFAAAFLGWHTIISYPGIVMHGDSSSEWFGVNAHAMICLRGLVTFLCPPEIALKVSLGIMVVGMLGIALLWRAALKRPQDEERMRWAMAITVVILLLCSPHSHTHDGVILVLPAALTLRSLDVVEAFKIRPASLLLWNLTLIFYPLLTGLVFLYWEFLPSLKSLPNPVLAFNIILLATGLAYIRNAWQAGEQNP